MLRTLIHARSIMAISRKKQSILSRLKTLKKVVKTNGKGKARTRRIDKSRVATLAQAQGVGAVTRVPFQQRNVPTNQIRKYLDATLPNHLPLPRSVGPYTIVRTTQILNSNAATIFFNFLASEAGPGAFDVRWLAACGVELAAAGPINAPTAAGLIPMVGMDPLLEACTVSPAALTVQIMNPNPLQSTQGIAYIGRSSAQYELENSTRTWDQLGQEFVQFMAPRLCSAGKLALRGVVVNSYPLDMSEVSEFRGIRPFSDIGTPFDWTSQNVKPSGFAPIVCYNPNNIALQYLVTMEWRVRFDPSNPAAGSHAFHGTAPDSLWDAVTRDAVMAGHGVEDIAELVGLGGAARLAWQARGAGGAAEALGIMAA